METHLNATIRPMPLGYGRKASTPRTGRTASQDDFLTRREAQEQNSPTKDQNNQDTREGTDAKGPLDQLPGTDANDALNTINTVQQKCIETIVKEDLLSTFPGMDVDDALETINDVQQKCIETVIKEDLLDKLPGMDVVNNALETISDVQQKCIETVVTVVNTVTRVSLMCHITALQDLTHDLLNSHPEWEQSRILTELRNVDHGSDDDSIWGVGSPLDGESRSMTVDEQNQYRKIRQDMIEQAEFDIGRVLLTMDNRRHTDEVFDSLPTLSKNLGTLMKTTFTAIDSLQMIMEIPTKAELMGKIDGTNIANRMERGHEMDALFDYYLGEGQHCGNITIRDRFTVYEADQRMNSEKWAMHLETAKVIEEFFDQKNLREDQEEQEENELKFRDTISSEEMNNRIDESVEKKFDEMIDQPMLEERINRIPESSVE